jgi:hypothetical protein
MFEFDLGFIGPLIVISSVVAKPYILKKLNREGTLVNVVYFLVIMLIGVPLYMLQGKFTLASMNDASAKELVNVVLQQDDFNGFKDIKNIKWTPFSKDQNLYSIKADMTENSELYHIYMQPTCEFFNGCEITMDKILIVKDKDLNIPINYIDEQTFEKRPCSDRYIKSVLLNERISTGFKVLFENYSKVPGTTASQSIDYIKISNIHESKATNLTDELKKLHLLNSCQATYEIKGDFVMKKGDNNYMPIMELLFDEVKLVEGKYIFVSKVDYNIFYNQNNQIVVAAQPFNMEKISAAKKQKEKN